ncbi:MAG: hypothetical protein JXK07_16350 [Spirochaetes bacterium]|nr:hypothetical protein [Spirochaetota bacterium]MBN2771156.1 hypothetical protein [Spirochaetota bacterium]
MKIVFENFWLFFIIAASITGINFKIKSKKYIKDNPELKSGYNKMFTGWMVFGNIPWIIVGIGSIGNYTKNIFDYFNPKNLNPFVLIFYISIIFIWVLSVYWIYFKNGAEFIEKHPGLFIKRGFGDNLDKVTAKQIKILLGLGLLGGIIGLIMIWIIDFPLPVF